ncbi:MAG: MFS transporter [Desulfarculaceae bacterium]|nr:MFS transporter [Desulfarculaceae bacterium]MCF8049108.1 MFS transporter [Desulfarculaceae bacterium]MCF8063937.1 MFS transporter [Desulfarculaceae bacterium]MCF8099446.1 MFS transporter [Desulfarculaceae bacterium]MCF8122899.1 MFS transporter [Desulfarculaceae bacterium]
MSWLIWGLGALLYLIGFYQRVAPAVITKELMSQFSLSAAALGNLSAYYFYAYVAMQLPTGVLADHWGPRRLLCAGALVAGVGSVLFGMAPALVWAELGRLLVGGAVAVAWVALLKLAGHWFNAKRFAAISGMGLLVGVVGAVTAGVPLRLMVDAFGWRPVMVASGAITLALALAIWLVIRDDPSRRGWRSYAPQQAVDGASCGILAGVGRIWRYPNTLLLFFASGGLVGPVLTFAGLWGVPYLSLRYGLTPAKAAFFCSVLMIAWAMGGPIMGALSDRMGKRKPLYLGGALVVLLSWLVMLYLPGLPLWAFVVVSIISGLASGTIIITFAWCKESVPAHLGGTVSGAANMGVMLGPTLLQPVVGWLLDLNWGGQVDQGARVYDLSAFQVGFVPMMAWIMVAVVLVALARESHCRQLV